MKNVMNRHLQRSSLNGLLIMCILALPAWSTAAELKPETLTAWNQYVQTARSQTKSRLDPGRPFLWVDEVPSRLKQVKQGQIVVAPVVESGMIAVPDGLIHDWIGAAFFPGIAISQLRSVLEDYDRYKDVYSPNVVDSHMLGRNQMEPNQDGTRLSLRLVNKMSMMTAALDTEYEVQTFTPDSNRVYAFSRSTNVQQIRNYGKRNEVDLPAGHGDGYIWQLCSIYRYEERDGGVYMEMEVMALTRDIPTSLGWLLRPIIARMSRNSILICLTQTRKAVVPVMQTARSANTAVPALLGAER